MTRVKIEPILEAFPGWQTDSTGIATGQPLPPAMESYIAFINRYLGVPVTWVSNGPGRDQIIAL
jgi:adenylosuccinate synthase